ncbi:MAG: DNA gyrase inhibitor YacG [Burkholderiaceae bacterium]|nr:DNA gyrase inhibitor YacG [Burkholderiaceae bacterium]
MDPTPGSPFEARKISCPSCGEPSLYSPENIYRPFCSKRCKNLDLGAWANEAYRVQAQPQPASDDVDPNAPD